MDKKLFGTLLGVSALVLWFMPFVYVDFMGQEAYQSGQHIGGIAYLLLLAALCYSIFSWMGLHIPRLIASGLGLAICLLFAFQAGAAIAWGLIAAGMCYAISAALALLDQVATKA